MIWIIALMIYLSLVPITWILYLAVMTLMGARDRGSLTPMAEKIGTTLYYIALFCDFALNVLVGSVLFLELPKEYLLSPRVSRLQRESTGYRQRTAAWICQNLLNPFDASGCHCK